MQHIAVYCGARLGHRPVYQQAAEQLGEELVRRGFGLVYGGSRAGLMGTLADAALAVGGSVIGVFPERNSSWEEPHPGVTDLRVVSSMHERKAMMADLSDGMIALPGGFGTLDEVFEMLTWRQMGIHGKPIGFLNVDGFFDRMFLHLIYAEQEGLIKSGHVEGAVLSSSPSELLDALGFVAIDLDVDREAVSLGEGPRS